MGKTIYEKIWNDHLVREKAGDVSIIYVDKHLVHEVTSPQAFDGLRQHNRSVRHALKTMATMDHNVPTKDRDKPIANEISALQMKTLEQNCRHYGIELYDLKSDRQGIVHVVAPELGVTQPGMIIVCGDSHTSTHGAFGALAFGIGTTEVEHVLSTQTLQQYKSKTMQVLYQGDIPAGSSAKDLVMACIGKIGTAGGSGYVLEYSGDAIKNLSVEARMTMCNMSIEGGARAGLVSPDEKIYNYLKDKPFSPKGEHWEQAVDYWKSLATDDDAKFDKVVTIESDDIIPQVTWGTSPEQVTGIDSIVPTPDHFSNHLKKQACEKALKYMGLKGGEAFKDVAIDYVFIGSCTNSRIEDLRAASKIVQGKKVSSKTEAIVVPGSVQVKKQAEEEGLDSIFKAAGFEWRDPGCSMCLAMNDDKLNEGQRCASTSNRNFEGRQGKGGRTHLMSPIMAAAAAINGKIVDVREYI